MLGVGAHAQSVVPEEITERQTGVLRAGREGRPKVPERALHRRPQVLDVEVRRGGAQLGREAAALAPERRELLGDSAGAWRRWFACGEAASG